MHGLHGPAYTLCERRADRGRKVRRLLGGVGPHTQSVDSCPRPGTVTGAASREVRSLITYIHT